MKLASLRDGSRDGRLLVVRRDLERAVMAESAHTLKAALDDWAPVAPKLEHEADAPARHAREDSFAFYANHCPAPPRRDYQRPDERSVVTECVSTCISRGAPMP